MLTRLNKPQRIILYRILITRHLLLLKAPLRQLDLVRKEIAPLQRMPQPKLRPQRPHPLLALLVPPIPLGNLDDPVIVRISNEALESIRRDLVLEIHLGHRRAVVVRVQVLLRRGVPELDALSVREVNQRVLFVVLGGVPIRRRVQQDPVVIVVSVRVQRDLLLCNGVKTGMFHHKNREYVRLDPVG